MNYDKSTGVVAFTKIYKGRFRYRKMICPLEQFPGGGILMIGGKYIRNLYRKKRKKGLNKILFNIKDKRIY
jgi:hypothetical protein